jgi:multidrug efflux system membrane fusion protein
MARPGERPPLLKGMFVEVEFRGREMKDRIVLPLTAIHEGRVYVADKDNRLEIRDVQTEFVQFDDAVISKGVNAGDRVVLSDIIPAIPGMLLDPITED